jgi:hypothetical protein
VGHILSHRNALYVLQGFEFQSKHFFVGGNCVFDRANGRVSRRQCISSKVFVRRLKQWTGRVVFDVKVKMDCAPPTVAIASAVTTIAAFASTAFESAPSGSLPAAASSYSSHEFKLWARN